jgi:hypothetical protein
MPSLGVPELALQTQPTLAGRLLLVHHVQKDLTAELATLVGAEPTEVLTCFRNCCQKTARVCGFTASADVVNSLLPRSHVKHTFSRPEGSSPGQLHACRQLAARTVCRCKVGAHQLLLCLTTCAAHARLLRSLLLLPISSERQESRSVSPAKKGITSSSYFKGVRPLATWAISTNLRPVWAAPELDSLMLMTAELDINSLLGLSTQHKDVYCC